MLAIASQIILCLVLAALIGLIIGYLLGKTHCPKPTYKTTTPLDQHTHDDGACEEEESSHTDTVEHASSVTLDTEETSAEPAGLLSETKERLLPQKAKSSVDKAQKKSETLREETGTKELTEVVPNDDDKPVGLMDAPQGEKDNLTRIKGIGVKIESLLNEIGVFHFHQIAAWNEKEAHWIDHQVSFPGRALRDDWIGQAKLLAEGRETDFSKRVDAGEVSSSHKS